MTENKMTLTVDAISINVGFTRSVVAAFVSQLNPTVEEVGDIKTAVSEAITNCVVHAYSNNGGQAQIKVAVKGKIVEIEIVDYGQGIDDVAKAMQPFFTSSYCEERSGMGFTVMQAMMDTLDVTSSLGVGTTVKMTKKITSSVEV
ncbi:MAG: anti-sigma F factor [Clostridia bacterium]